jgi:Reverse transcriptase (RNA-dependent DNA polymerase)
VNDIVLQDDDVVNSFSKQLYECASSVLGFINKKHEDWFVDSEQQVSALLEEKRHLQEKILSARLATERSRFVCAFRECKARVQREVRRIKNDWWRQKAQHIQRLAEKRDHKAFFEQIRTVFGPTSKSLGPVTCKSGTTLLRNPGEIKARWREHFSELFNLQSFVSPNVLDDIVQVPLVHELDVSPTLEEVSAALRQLNTGKAPGSDGIVAELLQYGGDHVTRLLHSIFQDVWQTGRAPQSWKDAILVTLFKNGSKECCDNYRGISLLSVVGKVFSRVLLNRLLQWITPTILPESQCGFRQGRGTVDMIFTARQIQEKCIEQQLDLYQCFIDMTKAFDSVNRPTLWKLLGKLGCPPKFAGLIRSLHDDMMTRVCINGELLEPFPVKAGVKQGDLLAPTLFAMYFAVIFQKAFARGDVGVFVRYRTSGKLLNLRRLKAQSKAFLVLIRDLLYADDCDLVAHSEADLQLLMDCFSTSCSEFGLSINLKKTVVMLQPAPRKVYVPPSVFVNGTKLKVVDSFVYLGSTLSNDNSLDKELLYRIAKAAEAFGRLQKRVWLQSDLSISTKVSVYNSCVLATLLYGCETWTLYSRHLKQLERFHQQCLRRVLMIGWKSFVPDTEILKKAGIQSIESTILKYRLRWLGHVVRLQDSRLPKQLLYGELLGSRPPFKPRKRFKDGIKDALKKAKISLDTWEQLAQDRLQWRHLVSATVAEYERSRMLHCAAKRAARKGQPTTQANSYCCHICGRVCASKAGLASHGKRHANRERDFEYRIHQPFVCIYCGKACKCASGLSRHMKICHPAERLVKSHLSCTSCGLVCRSLAGLKSHLRKHQRQNEEGLTRSGRTR